MGIVWIGLLGSFAALILRWSTTFGADNNIGTDTLFLIVLGVVANDIGALARRVVDRQDAAARVDQPGQDRRRA